MVRKPCKLDTDFQRSIMKNVISINKNKEKGLSIDFVTSYPELFNDENKESDENDED